MVYCCSMVFTYLLGGSSHLVSRFEPYSYKWINPNYPTEKKQGYNLLVTGGAPPCR